MTGVSIGGAEGNELGSRPNNIKSLGNVPIANVCPAEQKRLVELRNLRGVVTQSEGEEFLRGRHHFLLSKVTNEVKFSVLE